MQSVGKVFVWIRRDVYYTTKKQSANKNISITVLHCFNCNCN